MAKTSSPLARPRLSVFNLAPGDLLLAATLFGLVLAIYWPVRNCDFINYDDPDFVYAESHVLAGPTRQSLVWAFTPGTGPLWQPLTMLSFMMEVKLCGGAHPAPMHLDNVLIHASAAAGWYLLLRGMTGFTGASFIVAALFGLHPAHVESVAWVTERKDVLSMLFLVLSLSVYWRYTAGHRLIAYVASMVLFCLGLMSKPMMVTQPLLMLLLDFWPLARTRFGPPTVAVADIEKPAPQVSLTWLILEKIPFFAAGALVTLMTLRLQAHSGVTPDLNVLTIGDRISTALVNYIRYLGIALWPKDLAIYYPYRFDIPTSVVVAAGALLVMVTVIVIRLRNRWPSLAVGWFWYVITLLPVIGLLQAGSQGMADRYTYLPFVGLSIALVFTVARWLERIRPGWRHIAKQIGLGCGLLIVTACAIATSRYLPYWNNSISLFTRAAESNGPTDCQIEFHIAEGYGDAGQPRLAIEHYGMALQAIDDQPQALLVNLTAGATHMNLANLLMRHSAQDALPHYEKALKYTPALPLAHYNFGICLRELHRNADAAREFQRALQLDPDLNSARQALADLNRYKPN